MTDIRAARQTYLDNKLEILNMVLNQLDDDNDSTPMTKLCRRFGRPATGRHPGRPAVGFAPPQKSLVFHIVNIFEELRPPTRMSKNFDPPFPLIVGQMFATKKI